MKHLLLLFAGALLATHARSQDQFKKFFRRNTILTETAAKGAAKIEYPDSLALGGDPWRWYIETFAGSDCPVDKTGFCCPDVGDGGPATNAKMCMVLEVAIDAKDNIYVTDWLHNKVKKITQEGIITTIAGTGNDRNTGDGGPATAADITSANGLAFDKYGNLYIGQDLYIRKVDTNGIITTICGNGIWGYSGDGGPATNASVNRVLGVRVSHSGMLYFSDHFNNVIRRIEPSGKVITVAGGFKNIGYFVFDSFDNIYIADAEAGQIIKMDWNGANRSVLAGTGEMFRSGDGGPATAAGLFAPVTVAIDEKRGAFYVTEDDARVREIDRHGIIRGMIGNSIKSFGGDGGYAIDAGINYIADIVIDSVGRLYLGDGYNSRVRRVYPKYPPSTIQIIQTPEVSVVPNPSSGKCIVKKSKDGVVLVSNMLGQQVLKNETRAEEVEIFLDQPGVYLVNVIGQFDQSVQRLIVQK